MKKIIYILPATLLVISAAALLYSFTIGRNTSGQKNNKASGFAVVELFTSEGCSSCPPADEAVARLLSKNLDNVYILSFHVDYWNRMGWTDPFSEAQFSERQQKYATTLAVKDIYTPQVIVNGATEFVGSDETKLNQVIEANLHNTASDLVIETKRAGNSVAVNYQTSAQGALLNLALVQPEATTEVKRGENSGRTLHHVNIVRMLQTTNAREKGNLTIEIPQVLARLPLEVVAFTQSKKTLKILGAA